MRPRIEDSIGDDAMEDCGFLKFTDDTLKVSFLQTLNTMRKHRLFCDVVLNVDNTDIHAHKNVLACVSPHLMELFSAEEVTQNGRNDGIPSYRLNGLLTKIALEILVEYAYTAQLEVPDALVKDVYLAAWQLKIDRVVGECARHLIDELSADSCIDIRSLPGISKNKQFVLAVDDFILREFENVSKMSAAFLQLSCITIDVLYKTKQDMSVVAHQSLCRLVLDWIKRQVCEESVGMTQLLERSHLLYLALDNSLQDCSNLPPGHESESDLVQDYKRLVLKCPNNTNRRRKQMGVPVRPRVLIYSRDIGQRDDEQNQIEPDWNLLGSTKVAENTFLSLVTINGALTRVSVQLRLNLPPTTPSPVHAPESAGISIQSQLSQSNTSSNGSINGEIETNQEPELFCEVATMSGPKCGLGVAELNGKLLVCGGYDRGECLRSVESYDPEMNEWSNETKMSEARGRFQVTVLDNVVYAIGGSNGTTELDTVERLEPNEKKWRKCCKLPLARSNAGVCSLNDNIYCIGGWNGQIGIKQCDVYCLNEDKWTSISPLNTGRYQAGVTVAQQKIWVAGGSDAWACLNSVETYDPETDTWTFAPPLLTPRRGCGLAEFNGKLYAVGGSDGTHSLSTTEIFDEINKVWTQGPSLTSPRANVSVVEVAGKLYAIGGFSGKCFLNTVEYLDANTNEWTTFVNVDIISQNKHLNGTQQLEMQLQKLLLKNEHSSDEYSNTNGCHHLNGASQSHSESESESKLHQQQSSDEQSNNDAINS